jgi:hypothetical protein
MGDVLNFLSNEISREVHGLSEISHPALTQTKFPTLAPTDDTGEVPCILVDSDARGLSQHLHCSLLLQPLLAYAKEPKVLVAANEVYNMVIMTNISVNRLYR